MQLYVGKQLYYIVEGEVYCESITSLSNTCFWFDDYAVNIRKPDRMYFNSAQEALAELKKQETAYTASC